MPLYGTLSNLRSTPLHSTLKSSIETNSPQKRYLTLKINQIKPYLAIDFKPLSKNVHTKFQTKVAIVEPLWVIFYGWEGSKAKDWDQNKMCGFRYSKNG